MFCGLTGCKNTTIFNTTKHFLKKFFNPYFVVDYQNFIIFAEIFLL